MIGDRKQLHSVNVEGTARLLKLAEELGVEKVVYTSSTAAVGMTKMGERPLDENAPFLRSYQQVPYMQTKREAETLSLSQTKLKVVAVNPATIYGAGDVKLNTGIVFRKLKEGKLQFCPPGGTSVVSVADVVSGHLLAMQKGEHGRRYILSTSDHTFQELFTAIAKALQVQPPKRVLSNIIYPFAYGMAWLGGKLGCSLSHHIVRVGFSQRYFSAERAKVELGWQPSQSLEEMIEEAATFYLDQKLI